MLVRGGYDTRPIRLLVAINLFACDDGIIKPFTRCRVMFFNRIVCLGAGIAFTTILAMGVIGFGKYVATFGAMAVAENAFVCVVGFGTHHTIFRNRVKGIGRILKSRNRCLGVSYLFSFAFFSDPLYNEDGSGYFVDSFLNYRVGGIQLGG